MSSATTLGCSVLYSGNQGSASWEGRIAADHEQFRRYLRDVVRARIADAESSFASDLLGLATTGMATEFVERLLASVPDTEGWEIGEAFAECALRSDSGRDVLWPWNLVRDRRTPRASLPGADLVGFVRNGDAVLLLFGEVKTSSDMNTPPGVMYGGSGMVWQLEESATRLDVQHSLLKWLQVRCRLQPYRTLFERAVARYLMSAGKEFLLIGVLVRDTSPNQLDLGARGEYLSTKLTAPTRVELIAWYLPVPIAEWPNLLQGQAQ